jgi:hypothetical protein
VHDSLPPERADDDGREGLRWWKELLYVGGFYLVYTIIRDQFGSASVGAVHALHNAERVIRLERWLGLFHEQQIQHFFLRWPWLIRAFDVYYGSLHFVVPVAVLLLLFREWPTDYRRWRNTLAATTALALIGFSFFPLMPPRLLCDCAYGAGPGFHYGFVDTLARYGGLWTFDSGAMKDVSNQYAAMPSLHLAWALWCTLALWPHLRRRWTRLLAVAYPLVTLLAIVVTANHYLLDAVAGVLTLGAGMVIGWWLTRLGARRRDRAAGAARRPVGEAVP